MTQSRRLQHTLVPAQPRSLTFWGGETFGFITFNPFIIIIRSISGWIRSGNFRSLLTHIVPTGAAHSYTLDGEPDHTPIGQYSDHTLPVCADTLSYTHIHTHTPRTVTAIYIYSYCALTALSVNCMCTVTAVTVLWVYCNYLCCDSTISVLYLYYKYTVTVL